MTLVSEDIDSSNVTNRGGVFSASMDESTQPTNNNYQTTVLGCGPKTTNLSVSGSSEQTTDALQDEQPNGCEVEEPLGTTVLNKIEPDAPGTTVLSFKSAESENEAEEEVVKCSNFSAVHFSLKRSRTGETYALQNDKISVGKSKYADVQIKNTQTVSRIHAIFFIEDGKLFVEDNQSLNGTFVNNEKLASGNRREVYENDVIRLSDEEFCVQVTREEDAG